MTNENIRSMDVVSVNLRKIDALINSIVGEGFDGFRNIDADNQHWLLMTISDLSFEAKQALETINGSKKETEHAN